MIHIINHTLGELLAKKQEEADAVAEVVAKKREELEASEAEVEEKAEQMEKLREEAQEAADDAQWQTMYDRLSAWSRDKGHCNPRRNWKAKIDAEEKGVWSACLALHVVACLIRHLNLTAARKHAALGNWSGKQRRQERQGQLNRFKKAALERIGFSFDPKKAGWEEFHGKLKEYLNEHGKLPEKITDLMEAGLYSQLRMYRKIPKDMLGIHPRGPYKKKGSLPQDELAKEPAKSPEAVSAKKWDTFTQNRIDVLTDAGLDWMLTAQNVQDLKEKRGLIFPMPIDPEEEDLERDDLPALMKHHWLTMFEALVEFKRKRGHTFVTESNSTAELYHWVCQQRKRMRQRLGKCSKSRKLKDHQAEMLLGLDFVYTKGDIEWMDNYERLKGEKSSETS